MREIKLGMSVTHELTLRHADGSVTQHTPPDTNMITDYGMDLLSVKYESEVFEVMSYGTGTTPTNKRTAEGDTTVVDGVATSETGIFSLSDVGCLAVFSNGDQARVVSVQSEYSLTLDTALNLVDVTMAIYFTEQTALVSPIGSTTSMSTAADANGVAVVEQADTLVINRTRTFQISVPGGTSLAEFGLSDGIGNLFARWVPESPVIVAAGDVLEDRVTLSTVVYAGVTHVEATGGKVQGFGVTCDCAVPPIVLTQENTNWISALGLTILPDAAKNAWAYSPCSPYARDNDVVGVNQRVVVSPYADEAVDVVGTVTVDGTTYAAEIREGDYGTRSNRRTLQTNIPGVLAPTAVRSISLINEDNVPSLKALLASEVAVPLDRSIRVMFVKSWTRTRGTAWEEMETTTTTTTSTTTTTPAPVLLSFGEPSTWVPESEAYYDFTSLATSAKAIHISGRYLYMLTDSCTVRSWLMSEEEGGHPFAGMTYLGGVVMSRPTANDLFVTEDGTTMLLATSGDPSYVAKYTLSTPFIMSSAAETQAKEFSYWGARVYGVSAKQDGTTMVIVTYDTNTSIKTYRQYTMGTPWDLTTATQIATLEAAALTPLLFNREGTQFVDVNGANIVQLHTLLSPWSITGATVSLSPTPFSGKTVTSFAMIGDGEWLAMLEPVVNILRRCNPQAIEN